MVVVVLVVLGLMEQRLAAVRDVLEGAPVVEVARRCGVSRQTVHRWLQRYAEDEAGAAALVDRTHRPLSCPHQMPVEVEARVVWLRREHPGWGPDRIVFQVRREGLEPVPSRSGVYRALVRHGLIDPTQRRRKRSDYRRWERDRPMELWQMDVMGGVHLVDGSELKVVTGIDDYSRFVISAKLVGRATARPVCQALREAMARHGVPEQLLTDNGKVFTGRFGPGKAPVLFDHICHEHGIKHLLTAPYSPTTTGKVERLHKTMRREHFDAHEREYASIEQAQAALDAWVIDYNYQRPHQALGMRPPVERFRIAPSPSLQTEDPQAGSGSAGKPMPHPPGVTRWVSQHGTISLARTSYPVGRVYAGQLVEAVTVGGVLQIWQGPVLIASCVARRSDSDRPLQRARSMPRPATAGPSVIRIADGSGHISFAGTAYACGRTWRRKQVEVRIVGESVQISRDGDLIRVYPIRHDRSKEHGAFATPLGRPRKHRPFDPVTGERIAADGGGVKATAAPRSA